VEICVIVAWIWAGAEGEVEGEGGEDYPEKVCDGRGKMHCCGTASRPSGTRRRDSCAPKSCAPRFDQTFQSAPATHLDLAACSISGIWARALAAPGRSIGVCTWCHVS
jgi:hypothetical protein